MYQHKVSIVLPSYNRVKYLQDSIESCIKQSFKDFELIIIDDFSNDGSFKVAVEYSKLDSRIKVIRNNVNKKLPGSLNIAFKKAKGEYYTWISDDNLFLPKALEKMSSCLDNMPKIGLVYANYNLINQYGEVGRSIIQDPPEFLPIRDCVGACFMYRASIARIVGEYNEEMFLVEDYEYWLRFGLITNLYHINESLYFYRVHQGSLTKQNKFEIKFLKKELKKKYSSKYIIPKNLKPINDLYLWFIHDKNFKSYFKLCKIVLLNPITIIFYVTKYFKYFI